MSDAKNGAARSVISTRAVELIVAAIAFAVGVVMIVDNSRLGAGWTHEGPQSGYFPLRIGVIICIASVLVFAQALAHKGASKPFVTRDRLKPVLLVLIPTLVYVASIQFIGIYVASALLIAAFMRAMDQYSWTRTLLISVGLNVVLFWLFEIQFLVPLPKGPVEALFGY